MNRKITAFQLCLAAMAACINVAGGQLALTLRLPVYLDSIGTILAGIWMGPVFGMVPNLVSGVILGLTTDVYSLYFAPVGMVTGFMAGLAGRRCTLNKKNLFFPALAITVPGTVISSLICAVLFGGITSSGSTAGKDSTWDDGKCVCGSDFDGLYGSVNQPVCGSLPSAGAAV